MSNSLHVSAKVDTGGLDDLSRKLTELSRLGESAVIADALREAGEVVVEEVSALVNQKAKTHPRGQLADSITMDEPVVDIFGGTVHFGWRKEQMQGASGSYRSGGRSRAKKGTVKANDKLAEWRRLLHGDENGNWQDRMIAAADRRSGSRQKPERKAKGSSGRYTDGYGRVRKATTVDDYARILEYSETRQLRHMEEGFDSAEKEALDVLEKAIDKEIERIMG